MKRTYSLDTPDQQRLKVARAEIEAVLKKHDLAGVVTLHTPGMTEFFYDITPSYSCVWIDEKEAQVRDQAASANMIHGLAQDLLSAASMFGSLAHFVSRTLNAEHTAATYRSDPMEARKQ